MEIQNSDFSSLEQMTGRLLKGQQNRSTIGQVKENKGVSFEQILALNQKQIDQRQISQKQIGQKQISQRQIGQRQTDQKQVNQKQQIQQGRLKFSKHASERLSSRNIDLSETQLKRLESGAKWAGEKGIKESLVMVDDLAFIVNIKNNTVITAVSDSEDKIFTNIDGAVIS